MIKERLGTDLDRLIVRVLPFVARLRVHPDTLTSLGAGISVLAAAAFAWGEPVAAAWVMLAAGFCDLVDGVVARAQGTASAWGAFYDSSMDRLADLCVFSGIAVGYARDADAAGVALVSAAQVGSVMTSYVRARAEKHVPSLSVGLMERGERWGILMLGAVSGWLEVALAVIAVGAGITALQRLVAARRLLTALEPRGDGSAAAPPPGPR
jgi:CDP-diacylglycerol---glycerol-3-phosphate 3-phosphatidyltransferase